MDLSKHPAISSDFPPKRILVLLPLTGFIISTFLLKGLSGPRTPEPGGRNGKDPRYEVRRNSDGEKGV